MALKFIVGSSGSGKSHYVYSLLDEIVNEDSTQKCFVIVPEQFTMQTQKELVTNSKNHSILNIDVLSFNSLANRVFEDIGFTHEPILEDMGKTLMLQKVIWDNKAKIKVLSNALSKNGGVLEMKSTISELMQYRVGLDTIEELKESKNLSPLLKGKLADIGVIFEAFKEAIDGKYLAAEEVCEALANVFDRSDMLKGQTVVMDGFTGFVPMQLLVLKEILKAAKDVYVIVTADEKAGVFRKCSPENLFYMSHQMVESVKSLAVSAGVMIDEPLYIDSEEGRFKGNSEIAFLEKNLFRFTNRKYEGDTKNISIIEAKDTKEEIKAAAALINKLIRTKGLRYGDFAVVSPDIDIYGSAAKRYFEDCGIECFLDEKIGVDGNPFVVFLSLAVKMIEEDFSYDSVFGFLRCYLTDLTKDEIDKLENYCLGTGIRGYKRYSEKWVRVLRGSDPAFTEEVNVYREKLMDGLASFIGVFKTRMSTVEEKTKALYELCTRYDIQRKLKKKEDEFKLTGSKLREKEYFHIYASIMDFLDKLVSVLGDEKIGTAAYSKLLECGFSQLKVGVIPTGIDEVFIGDLTRSRIKNIKVLILMGVNDGLVPKAGGSLKLLCGDDRERLKEHDIELALSEKEEMLRQRLYLYLTLTLASDSIYLTYSKTDDSGKTKLPSYLIGTLKKMFPGINMICSESEDFRHLMLETVPGRKVLFLNALRSAKEGISFEEFMELYISMKNDPAGEETVGSYIEASRYHAPSQTLREEIAKELYNFGYSVTRLQEYAKCAFSHFCKYGLGLKEREVYEIDNRDIGTIFHDTLYYYFKAADAEGGVANISEKRSNELILTAVDDAIAKNDRTVMLEGARNKAATERFKRIMINAADTLRKQMMLGEFVTVGLEEKYNYENIRGSIDRYDVCGFGDSVYVRVIDYKSSEANIDYQKLFYGLQIQLPIYLCAALDIEKKKNEKTSKVTKPCGIYYMNVSVPMIETDSLANILTDEEVMKEVSLSGLTIDDKSIVELVDKNYANGKKQVINVKLKKNGEFDHYSQVVSEENLELITRYTKKLVNRLEREIENGNVSIVPKSKPEDKGVCSSCTYCGFKSICGYDPSIEGYHSTKMVKYDNKNIYQAMIEELNGGEN